ncbi:MAG: class I SAM-dependent methyltransferase [Methylobacter sp.]|uniref:class I SAM-dependent methyltransferase n=1 Tax=Methylobacter sp. TaxID=2051955 RepID=UPI0025EC22DF|nr:class I SAM-dependent methyltransferase [Methylobacter sp.]MCK9622341.1 class I SAM-dependent methyltransferase [Methylobacter sp.]
MKESSDIFARYNTEYVNPTTLARYATSQAAWDEILPFHAALASDDYVKQVDQYYRSAIDKFGHAWWHLDIVNVLYAAAKLHQPKNYLEIGIRRGRSCAVVARGRPSVNIVACDMWMQNYAGMENPGPEFVAGELGRNGHTGEVVFLNGSSHSLIPSLFEQQSDLRFDLITVDGDHSEEGAYADLCNVIPRLAPGGILVFDDISHPLHPYLLDCWRRATASHPNLLTHEYVETGYGIAFAVKQI